MSLLVTAVLGSTVSLVTLSLQTGPHCQAEGERSTGRPRQ